MLKSLVLAALLSVTTTSVMAAPERYTLDPAHTTVAFLVEHVGYADTLGRFTNVSGSFTYDVDTRELSDVAITVKTESLNTDHEARDKHVRGKDFLNTGEYPEMTFTADSFTLPEDGKGELTGQLELLGETNPLTLSVTLNKAERYPFGHKKFTLGVSARGTVMRSEYGMDYGVANGLVGDTIELILETEAMQE